MKAESQRIAIAEACGWTWKVDDEIEWNRPMYRFFYKDAEFCHDDFTRLPDYLNDLNAAHEMEKAIWEHEKEYIRQLIEIRQTPEDAIFSTATQRAEALLRTLNLWVEEPVSEATVEGLR